MNQWGGGGVIFSFLIFSLRLSFFLLSLSTSPSFCPAPPTFPLFLALITVPPNLTSFDQWRSKLGRPLVFAQEIHMCVCVCAVLWCFLRVVSCFVYVCVCVCVCEW